MWEGEKCIGAVTGNRWSRSARRKIRTRTLRSEEMRTNPSSQETTTNPTSEEITTNPTSQETTTNPSSEIQLGFRIQARDCGDMGRVEVEWRWGWDVVLFESFCGKVKGIIQQSQSQSQSQRSEMSMKQQQ